MILHPTKSFWISTAGDYVPNALLENDLTCDVLVIGGGIAGISTAWHLRRLDAAVKVVLIEAEIIGFGASGRAAGLVTPQLGYDQLAIRKKYGVQRSLDAIAYGRRAVQYTREIIEANNLDSDFRAPGYTRVAFGDRWIKPLEDLLAFYQSIPGYKANWVEGAELQTEFGGNENFKAGIFEPEIGVLQPAKHVRALKRLAEAAGVIIYENTPAIELEQTPSAVRAVTPRGSIRADRMVVATNAYTNSLQGGVGRRLKREQAVYLARATVTEPLTAEQWQKIGWARRGPVASNAALFHWAVPTLDGRVVFNSTTNGGISRHGEYEPAMSGEGAAESEEQIRRIFPELRNVRRYQTWGGPISMTRDLVPHLGYLDGDRVAYICGCWGRGIPLNHLHGRTIAELLSGVKSELTDFWLVNHKKKPWPVPPFDYFGKVAAWTRRKQRAVKEARGTIFE
jgi:glycine/D-amino acid oxidase-like deaminating enzyme